MCAPRGKGELSLGSEVAPPVLVWMYGVEVVSEVGSGVRRRGTAGAGPVQ